MKKDKVRMIDVFIESYYLSADEDSGVLGEDPKISDAGFKNRVAEATVGVERLVARMKRNAGLERIQQLERLFEKFKSSSRTELEKLFSEVIPELNPQVVQVFHRKLQDDDPAFLHEEDQFFLTLLEHIDKLGEAFDDE